jgi:hypothetical protein
MNKLIRVLNVLSAHLDDGRVLLTAFDEFIVRKLCVLVSVHIPKDLVHSLWIWNSERKHFMKAE